MITRNSLEFTLEFRTGTTCDFMYRLSKHCEAPYTGVLLIMSILIIVAVTSLLFHRYKQKQERIKQKLRLDLYRQKQLVKIKQTDINLLSGMFSRVDSYTSHTHILFTLNTNKTLEQVPGNSPQQK